MKVTDLEIEFNRYRKENNITTMDIVRKITNNYKDTDFVTRSELIQQVKLANAKFLALEKGVNNIFKLLEFYDIKINTCPHCLQLTPGDLHAHK